MDSTQIIDILTEYGYWIMLPLMTIEGPVATMISATLARVGFFNVFAVFSLSVFGDVLGDIVFYYFGYFFGSKFVNKVGKYIGITESLVNRMKCYFEKHGGKIIFTVKSTTGLCWATFVTAGIMKMKFRRFLLYSFLGGLVWSSFLVGIGFFFGHLWVEVAKYLTWARWLVPIFAILFIIGLQVYKKGKTRRDFLGKNAECKAESN